jgi:hypothetical protein
MEAVIHDMRYPEPRIQAWWYSYQIGLTSRLMSVANHAKYGNVADHIYYIVIGVTQGIMSHWVAKDMIKLTHPKDWKRKAVTTASIIGWEADTLTFFAPMIPNPAIRGPTEVAALRTMIM